MVTQFITLDIDLKDIKTDLQPAVEAQLRLKGEPLRWAITAVHEGIVHIEAVVLQDLDHPFPVWSYP